jgi:hypothetical protein
VKFAGSCSWVPRPRPSKNRRVLPGARGGGCVLRGGLDPRPGAVHSPGYLVSVFNAGAAHEADFRRLGAITLATLSAVAPAQVEFWFADCVRDGERGCRVEVPRDFDINNAGTAIYR